MEPFIPLIIIIGLFFLAALIGKLQDEAKRPEREAQNRAWEEKRHREREERKREFAKAIKPNPFHENDLSKSYGAPFTSSQDEMLNAQCFKFDTRWGIHKFAVFRENNTGRVTVVSIYYDWRGGHFERVQEDVGRMFNAIYDEWIELGKCNAGELEIDADFFESPYKEVRRYRLSSGLMVYCQLAIGSGRTICFDRLVVTKTKDASITYEKTIDSRIESISNRIKSSGNELRQNNGKIVAYASAFDANAKGYTAVHCDEYYISVRKESGPIEGLLGDIKTFHLELRFLEFRDESKASLKNKGIEAAKDMQDKIDKMKSKGLFIESDSLDYSPPKKEMAAVYIMSDHEDHFKVGMGFSAKDRQKAFQTAHARPLNFVNGYWFDSHEMAFTVEQAAQRYLENLGHKKAADGTILGGEWFNAPLVVIQKSIEISAMEVLKGADT